MAVRELEPRTLEVILRPMRLWRDDLEQIESVMRQAATELLILTDKYQVDEIADLAQVRESRIKDLHFSDAMGRIQLVIKTSGGLLRILDPSLQERGMAAEIDQIAKRRRKLGVSKFATGARFSATGMVVLLGAVFAAVIAAVAGGMEFAKSGGLPPNLALLLIPLTLTAGCLGYLNSRNILYTKTRLEAPPWTKRNADALTTNAIVSAIFLFLGIWIGKLTS
ncbi:hypothetical protein V6W11_19815 [Micromonospora profundi]|uniref:hypothetical protein n=1 Tax=Micromonospora profundi TaxID=1420889 RepID=UPI002FF15475